MLGNLRGNYDLIYNVISDTTLGIDSPLYQMWQDIKKAIYVAPKKILVGNLEY